MRRAIIFSGILHVLAVGLAYFGLPELFDPPMLEEVPTLSVDLVTQNEIAEINPVQRQAPKKIAEKLPNIPKVPIPKLMKSNNLEPVLKSETVSKTPEPQPEPKTKPKPNLKTKPKPNLKTKPKPKPKPRIKKTKKKKVKIVKLAPKPKRKPKPPPDEFQKLLKNLTTPKKLALKFDKTKKESIQNKDIGSGKKTSSILGRNLKFELAKLVQKQIRDCWNIPGGAKDVQNMQISVRIRLRRDGSLLSPPRVIDSKLFDDYEFYSVVAESAVRALLNPKCSPLHLPYKHYDIWKDIIFSFNPGEALGR